MATTSAAGAGGSSIQTNVNGRPVIEAREAAIMIELMALFDREGGVGLAEQISRITNTFNAGDPISSVTNGATEGNAISDTDLTMDSALITPSARAASVVLTKVLTQSSSVDMPAHVQALLMRGLGEFVDKIAMALFSSLSNGGGTSGVRPTLGLYRASLTGFRNNAKSLASKAQVLWHPNCWGFLMDELLSGTGAGLSAILTQTSAADLFGGEASRGMLDSYQGTLLGVDNWQSTNVPASSNDRYNAIITGRDPGDVEDPMCSIGMVTKWSPDLSVHDLRVNAQLAARYMADMGLGVGILNNALSYYILASGI